MSAVEGEEAKPPLEGEAAPPKKLKKKKKKKKKLEAAADASSSSEAAEAEGEAEEEGSGSSMRHSTSRIMRAVDHHYARRLWGDPDGSLVFQGGKMDFGIPVPGMLDVPYWTWADGALLAVNDASTRERPASGRAKGLTRFATVGMSDVPQPDGTRIELTMAIARDLGDEEGLRNSIALFLAAVSAYPYQYQDSLGRDCFLSQVGQIPGYPHFQGLLLDEPDVDPGSDVVPLPDGGKVQLHLLVPLLPHEVDIVRYQGARALRSRWRDSWTDRLDPDRIGR